MLNRYTKLKKKQRSSGSKCFSKSLFNMKVMQKYKCADGTTLMAESEEELKSLLMK